jgi:hypothetical protein
VQQSWGFGWHDTAKLVNFSVSNDMMFTEIIAVVAFVVPSYGSLSL